MGMLRREWIAGVGLGIVATPLAAQEPKRRESVVMPSEYHEDVVGEKRVVTSNGMPGHSAGDFPNNHDPVPMLPQQLRFELPVRPAVAGAPTDLKMWIFGVAVNGVVFDPSGPFWNRDGASGWQFEVLAPAVAVALGIDVNHAHTQGRGGLYHYHGLPTGLLWRLRQQASERPMYLLGYAADGFPIYGPEGPSDPTALGSPTRRFRSSYRLKPGKRDGGPGGRHDGTFVEDFVYEGGSGDLDECNGRTGVTPEFPGGTYYYVLTDEFPFIPRRYRGMPDASFRHGPPPGVSPPVPPELMRYRGVS
jgi:hypothetical protein